MARLIVLCGLPCSGKTTTARRLVAARGGVRLCPDEWMQRLGIDLWDEGTRARVEQLQWSLGQELLPSGVDVIVEWGTWAREERDVLRAWCRERGVAVSLVHLDVDRDELARRLAERNTRAGEIVIPEHLLDEWIAGPFQPPTAEELALFDTLDDAVPPNLSSGEHTTRPWRTDDVPFLWEMLHQSIHVPAGQAPPPLSVVDEPGIAHYLRDFGRLAGDDAEVVVDHEGRRVAAAFCRRLPADDPGYGFVRADIPEFGMAVVGEHRGKGLGRLVLSALLRRHPRMSLSVDRDNIVARRFYDSLGFVEVGDDGNSVTMLRDYFEASTSP